MDKSWRETKILEGDSDDSSQDECRRNILVYDSDIDSGSSVDESDVAYPSQSKGLFDVPDSDESFNHIKNKISDSSDRQSVVPDSDDQITSDECETNSSLSLSRAKKLHRNSKTHKLKAANSSLESKSSIVSDKEESSPEITKSAKRKNKKFVLLSDDESVTFNISEVISGDPNGNITTVNEQSVIKDQNSTKSSTDSEESRRKPNYVSETSRSKPLPTIDLTLPIDDVKNVAQTSVNTISHVNLTQHKGVITLSSDTEDDEHFPQQKVVINEEELNDQFKKVNLTRHESSNLSKDIKKPTGKTGALQQTSENDYSSRLESLKAEQTRLDAQVKEVLKNIDTVKSTLKTANVAVLPDRGVRLQVNLKQYESKLRDLRYQQNTLSNEIIRLQIMPNKNSVPPPIQPQMPQPKIYKLPTTTTDINAMGKRALETHRTQQALTVDSLKALHNSLKNCPSENTLASDPAGLKVELMPHQKYALAWLLWREREKPSGGILADDMGLGKTLTMISLILKSSEEKQENSQSDDSESEEHEGASWLSSQRPKLVAGKTLVVCPASLLGQWEGEAQRRVRRGTIDILVHHGQSREKKARRLAKPDLVITTYNIVSRDADQPESPLFQVKWERVILDEAHQIRNHKTKTAQAVFRLSARRRWVLTGTPVQNKELDLYALLRFLRCSPFDDLAVWKAWVDNRDAAGKQRLNTIMKSIMLRRTKKGLQEIGELKNLPDRNFSTIMIHMDKEEWAVYEKLLNFSKTLFARFLHQKAEKENALQGIPLNPRNLKQAEDPFKDHPELARLHRQMNQISDVKSHHILVLLLRLRQFCCHPSLIQTMLEKDDISNVGIEDSDGLDIDLLDKMTRMSIVNEPQKVQEDKIDLTAMDKDNPLFAKERLSSKLRKVMETIDEILSNNDKLLVVSQWVSYLDLVHSFLQEKKIKCVSLTGQIPVKDRAELVEKFNRRDHGPKVMLLSLTAGGVGLNLTGANHLLLLDLHWNPQLENQACDRIYRVGQEKNVQIYKFVTSETIEETVLNLQQLKSGISDAVLTGAKQASSKLSLDELKMLFKIK